MTNIERIASAMMNGTEEFTVEAKSVGGGEWSIEIYSIKTVDDFLSEREFICEYVGSNGTRTGETPEPLYDYFYDDWAKARHMTVNP